MSFSTYIIGVLAALATLGVVIEMLRRRRLRERHALWWVIAGLLALVISVFPDTLIWAAARFGVDVPTNLVFFVSIAVLFLVCIQHSAELTDLESKTRTLVEMSALQDLRLRELESRVDSEDLHGTATGRGERLQDTQEL
ncbi:MULTISPECIES: DUF2304 domain-containing protein [Cryobacterium]|uniref:DUF2304 domain-containing protein n=1 Tax=Cryobacterium zongtaii TaxID=1259217 RepID=A0A2S3ZEJ3_9MICO|nr:MULTISPECIES: DUF2304 domain-containing protein [Cryobacterium]ASD22015.1 hypothetical protein B7495_07845 [Cryobacterium sp. LW097]POH64975.1 DUF2304 domain-containing protein [Cryobacterium zongtaii]POH68106.1 DUF2304 domain-containing protein [Cryobacterium zongtaii]TFC48105.1 DUF2304 domain-containing protein [Cryobacterium sp. TMN-39-2]TFC53411.1 DUF2304 domain-containing protein [Cryobacterium sp. TMB3-1-2]